MEVLARAFSPNGRAKAAASHTFRIVLAPGTERFARYQLLTRLDLAPGRYAVRVAVHNRTRGTTGSVYADATIPDFTGADLSLSGLVLTATPNPFTAPSPAVASLVPVVPSTQRVFSTSHDATAFVRIHQARKGALQPVVAEALITDAQGTETVLRRDSLDAAQFGAARAVDFVVKLPLNDLAQGAYLYSVRITGAGTVARGDVRFWRR